MKSWLRSTMLTSVDKTSILFLLKSLFRPSMNCQKDKVNQALSKTQEHSNAYKRNQSRLRMSCPLIARQK